MAYTKLVIALSALVATSPTMATTQSDWSKDQAPATAPAGTPETRYCMRVEPHTGSRIETIECWTREEWAAGGVDVDQDWPKEGVRVLNS